MKRYIAQFVRGGFPELYAVVDTNKDGGLIGEPKPYHEANDEAEARNLGTWGKPQPVDLAALSSWCSGMNFQP